MPLTLALVCATGLAAPPPAGGSAAPPPPTQAPATAPPQAMPSGTPQPPPAGPTLLHLKADRVEFYYDRFLVEADGHVSLTTSDGFSVTGDAFSMDLKLNRFLVAGHVTLRIRGQQVSGAAISDFLDFDRIYFVPVTTEPDRWTFVNGDLAHPLKGRVMPGDVFAFPQITGAPSLIAKGAVIGAKSYARFTGTTMDLGSAPIVPLGSFVVNFSSNPYFAQNTLTGATADLTWNVAGNENMLSAVHARYDPTNHIYASFEQHFVGQHEYAVFSINPATALTKWWNLQLFEALGSRFQIQTFTQFFATQRWLKEPTDAGQTTYLTATYALPHSYLSLSGNQTNYNVLGPGSIHVPITAGNLSHPSQATLTWTSFQDKLPNLPFYFQYYGSMGFNHDTVGAQNYANPYEIAVPGLQAYGSPCVINKGTPFETTTQCPTYTTIWNQILGFTISVPSVKFGNPYSAYDKYYLNATFNDQRQWYSLPHHVNTQSTLVSLSRQFSRPLSAYVAYGVVNTSDLYLRGGYPACVPAPVPFNPKVTPTCPLVNGVYVNSFSSFLGASTLRTLNVGTVYAPSPEFNFSVLFRKHDDFPKPYPGLFGSPLTNVLGQQVQNNYLGQPPYDITPDVRFRILPHMMLDVSRTYYFNFGNQKWNPTTIVQVLPQ